MDLRVLRYSFFVALRIVSLVASNTEIVHALGLADRLVGVDAHSDHPREHVRRLPRLGKELAIDIRRVAALRPDIVLASLSVPGHERVVEGLRDHGLPFLVTDPESLEEVFRSMEAVAEALDVATRGREVVERMREDMVPVVPVRGARPRVMVEWWPNPVIVPGRRSWVSDVVRRAGGWNPFEILDVRSRPVDPDRVRDVDPDHIVISWCGVPEVNYRPRLVRNRGGYETLRAVRENRIHAISEAFLGRPGPRLVQGYRAIRAALEAAGVEMRPH